MAKTLAEYRMALTKRIGTSVSGKFTEEKKISALNSAVRTVAMRYQIDKIVKTEIIDFVSGEATLPTDYVFSNTEKLYDARSNEGYEHVSLDRFDKAESNAWTIDTDGKMKITSGETISLTLRYEGAITEMTEDTDESGLPSDFDAAIVFFAAYELFFDAQLYENASLMKIRYEDESSFAWRKVRGAQGKRPEGGLERLFTSRFGNFSHSTNA